MKNVLVLPSIWRYLVKILNRIFMWSCGGGCRGKLPNSVHLSTSGYVNWNVKINHCFFASSFLWRNLSLFQLNLSLVFDVNYDWLLWLAGFWSNDTLHAALERFWIHSNARSIVSFAVSFSFTRDFTVTWIFSRLIKKSLSCIHLKCFLQICSRSCPICRHPLYGQANGNEWMTMSIPGPSLPTSLIRWRGPWEWSWKDVFFISFW